MAGEFSLEIGSDIFPEPGEGIQDPTYLQLRKFHNGGGSLDSLRISTSKWAQTSQGVLI